jgi:hypothetical protein
MAFEARQKKTALIPLAVPASSPRQKEKRIVTGVGLEPTLSFPNQEIDIKVNLNLAP